MVVGILGGGQLARMLALAGTPLGLRFRCLDPSPDAVAAHVSELIVGRYDDPSALARLSRGVRLVTFEFENVPAAAASWLVEHVAVAPAPAALAVAQDRLSEKRLFESVGMAVPGYRAADTRDALHSAVAAVGAPCIVKTRRFGYDGKGQARLRPGPGLAAATDAAFDALAAGDCGGLIVERQVEFERELSVLAVRSRRGEIAVYPIVENEHRDGILRRSRAPAPGLDPTLARDAREFVIALLERLDYVGVLAVELFVVGGRLLANEMAPRVHNSGHWTIEGSVCSQFENHLRAVLDFPLGSTAMAGGGFAAMVNLIGDLPSRHALLSVPGAHTHVYAKSARPARKVGHATIVAEDRETADALAARISALPPASDPEWRIGD